MSAGARIGSTSRRSTARRRASTFDVGWSGTASADTPDNVVVTLDKTNYAPGEEAKLRIASAFAGKATVALVGDQVERFIDVDLVAGDNVVPFPVGADWGPGAYAVALTHRPLDVAARRMPGRAIGVAWFAIDRDAHKLDIALDAPQLARPRASMTVPVKVAGLAPGEEAFVTVSAVDVGILNLTGFKTPDPGGYFFGQRKLPVEVRDLWGMLIDGMQGAAGAIHAGGDTGGGARRQSADAAAARALLGRRQARRRGRSQRVVRSAGVQRIGAADRGRVVEGQGRVGSKPT